MFEATDTVVLYDEVAYRDVIPVQWRALPGAIDESLAAGFVERNIRTLRALAAIDGGGATDGHEGAGELQRLDFKVNLLLDLVGQLLTANQPRPAPVPIRFNAFGALWRGTGPLPEPGSQGITEIHLRDALAEPLRLPGRIAGVTPEGRVKVRFTPVGDTTALLIEKLIIRHHRRQVAASRQPLPA